MNNLKQAKINILKEALSREWTAEEFKSVESIAQTIYSLFNANEEFKYDCEDGFVSILFDTVYNWHTFVDDEDLSSSLKALQTLTKSVSNKMNYYLNLEALSERVTIEVAKLYGIDY